MLLKERWKDKPSRDFIAIGMGCLWMGILMTAAGSHWFDTTPLLCGFLLGLAGVLIGLSIVVNIQGLKRYRTEQAGR
jgi:presenilin-like A22 family membrane protease